MALVSADIGSAFFCVAKRFSEHALRLRSPCLLPLSHSRRLSSAAGLGAYRVTSKGSNPRFPLTALTSSRAFSLRFATNASTTVEGSDVLTKIPPDDRILGSGKNNLVPGEELFNIIKSACCGPEGLGHHWLNNFCNDYRLLNQGGITLVLMNAFIQDDSLVDRHDRILIIERVKLFRKIYPKLNVIGLQCVSSANSTEIHSEVLKTIMEEYISFPILLLDRNLIKVIDSAVYLFFEGAPGHAFCIKTDTELGSIKKVINELSLLLKENMSEKLNGDRNQDAATEEPCAASAFRNLLLYNAGSLSVDEDGGRIFLSDSNHHRIIVTDCAGRILDSIGSSPGLVDADFESAKLCRPAASFYNVSDGCLYFVDSENNAIRRADMTRRLVETMYPISKSTSIWDRISGVWSWILNYFGLAKNNIKADELGFDLFASPWHLWNLDDSELIIISRSFAVAWTMSMKTWKLKEVIRGFHNILERYGTLIEEKLSCLRDGCFPLVCSEKISCADLMSAVANIHDDIITYDTVGQSLVKCSRKSMRCSQIHFSNMGVLGVPYWLSCPIERVFNSGRDLRRSIEHVRNFSVLPGRCDVRVNVEIPKNTVLAAPLDESCIWRQARGSAAEVSMFEKGDSLEEKVGVAQQWFDELDNLAFANPEFESLESSDEVDVKSANKSFEDTGKVHFNCAVNVSPGTSEVIVSAALYLKPNPALSFEEAASLLNSQNHENRMLERESFNLFLKKCGQISDIIFTKPLHLRIKLDCGDHPAAPTTKETILTDTRLELNVTLE
ncbi:uncharacterized protein LOC110023371 [Phalaenopsis equestris]|uniref:uncharacterized protein LOC110023371 n=1 Tax=Phalaenopsis equestris TaxID=78828 RepID=UPI0009E28654|nr:uncharacterized protein LOC110023371 [Phalaenopsis equestris]